MSNSSDEIDRLFLISRVLLISIGIPMFIGGTIGNFINILAFTRLPQFTRLSSSIFLLVSFISGQIDIFGSFLFDLIYNISGSDPLNSVVVLCKLRWCFGPLSGTVGLYSICLAAINQYLLTSRTVQYRDLITRRRAVFITIFILIFSFGLIGPALIFYTHVENSANMTLCSIANPVFVEYYTYLAIIIYTLIPVPLLTIFSLLTWYNIRHNLLQNRNLEQSLTRLLFAQIIMVLLTTVPNIVGQTYFFYTRTMSKSLLRQAQESVLSSILNIFTFSTFSLPFYTYTVVSKPFRRNIKALFAFKQNRVNPAIVTFNATKRQTHIHFSSKI
ncbi:unnamed protein product [Adineta steineri]|uniref:G-protein coupled receptors family 1 profile domain-containing protein n=1 Tax=Adineta steineri TaxID=433720 RepID=A0A815HY36_9BILA|nr:unnamed protein product [Adineta steineri]CAF4001019.1 unnamed protein product [Adineta steineri]